MSAVPRALGLILIAAAAAILGLLAATYVFKPRTQELKSGTLLEQARPLPEFMLTDADGRPFDKPSLEGEWTVVFVGFTHCPDVCPNTLALLRTVNQKLQASNRKLRVVFLSVDPERDTAAIIGGYVRHFDPDFIGVTGPENQLSRLGQAMGFVFAKAPGRTPEDYTIDHSSALILVDPQARVAGYFTPPLKVDALVTDLLKLLPTV